MMSPDDIEDMREDITELCSKLSGFLEKQNVKLGLGISAMLLVCADAIHDGFPEQEDHFIKLFLKFLAAARAAGNQ